MFGANFFGQPYFAQGFAGTGASNSASGGNPRPGSFLDIPRTLGSRTDKGTLLPYDIKALGSLETGKPFGLESEVKPIGFIENETPFDIRTVDSISVQVKDTNKPEGSVSEREPTGTMEARIAAIDLNDLDKPVPV